jgi:hypothetical protein
MGWCTASSLSNGFCNVVIGSRSLILATSGSCNIAIGVSSANGLSIGTSNVVIGTAANTSSGSVNNEVTIHDGVNFARFQGAATSWSFVSDARDKRNVEDLALGLEFIESLQPRKFEWSHRHTDIEHGKPATGFIAQEVLEAVEASDAHYANLVDTNNPDQYTLAQANLVPILVNAVKELSQQVKELQMYISRNPN